MITTTERPDEQRYVLLDDGTEIGEEAYVDVNDERVLFHTVVSPDYAGQGLASTMVTSVMDDIVARGMKAVAVCPYVKSWLSKHPDYAEHAVEATPTHLRAVSQRQR